jgi:hypothetical protein
MEHYNSRLLSLAFGTWLLWFQEVKNSTSLKLANFFRNSLKHKKSGVLCLLADKVHTKEVNHSKCLLALILRKLILISKGFQAIRNYHCEKSEKLLFNDSDVVLKRKKKLFKMLLFKIKCNNKSKGLLKNPKWFSKATIALEKFKNIVMKNVSCDSKYKKLDLFRSKLVKKQFIGKFYCKICNR